MNPAWLDFWHSVRKYVLNKYVLICLIFAAVLTFCGDQSLINNIRRRHQISRLEQDIEACQKRIDETNNAIEELRSGTDNLERYAREHYLMKKDGEDIYVVEEE